MDLPQTSKALHARRELLGVTPLHLWSPDGCNQHPDERHTTAESSIATREQIAARAVTGEA